MAPVDLPAGTLTLLFTDIEGSTRLQHALGDDRYAAVLGTHRSLLRAAFRAHGGVEVDTQGDALFYVFPRASQAAVAAVDAQRALAAHAWPEGGEVRVRMGLHTGEPVRTAEGYAGLDVHRAARICAAGHGGQVLLSEATAAQVRQALPASVLLRDLGTHRLKDLAQAEHLAQLDLLGLRVDFPPVRSLDTLPNNLPTPPTPLIGRQREIDDLVGLLHREELRLVTLTGPGGVGKTRLGLRVAADLLHDFTDGAFLVALAPLTDPTLVASAILRALGIQEADARPAQEVLTAYLRERELLLLLDNFEHLLSAAPMVAAVLAACPRLKLLVTSRAAVRLSGGREYAVAPLPLPPAESPLTPAALAAYPAVALFLERATAARADFALTDDNAPAVAAICARLDGLPLAMELAAARIKLFPPPALLSRLEHRLRVLTGGPLDLPARQQTLRDAIGWSYDLLSEPERAVFRRLAVFVGGCTLEAAEAICGGEGDVLDHLASLVDQSLIRVEATADVEPRCTMLETIREFALEQLAASGEQEVLQRQQADYFVALVAAAEPKLHGAERGAWLARLEMELDNLRAALAWSQMGRSADETGLRLAGALNPFWSHSGRWVEGRRWLEDVLARCETPERSAARAQALFGVGTLAEFQGDYDVAETHLATSLMMFRDLGDAAGSAAALHLLGVAAMYRGDYGLARSRLQESAATWRAVGDRRGLAMALFVLGDATLPADARAAQALYEESLALSRQIDDPGSIALPLTSLGHMALQRGAYDEARALFEEGLALRRQVGDMWLAVSLTNLGEVARCQGDYERAAALYQESLALYRERGDKGRTAWSLHNLGCVALHQGNHRQAAKLLADSLALERDSGNRGGIARCLTGLAAVAVEREHPRQAARWLAAAQALLDAMGAQLAPADRMDYEGTMAAVRTRLDRDAHAAAWAAGAVMPLEQAVVEALVVAAESAATPPAPESPGPAPYPDGLTAREVEVLRLLSAGRTNPEIAHVLVLSVHTVERHVANLYGKIGAHNRAEAATYAVRHGLL
jgi:predicted ATPase/class 3 adenylate cyclase/DNA-binding CsgD family transcriptional regulator